MANDRVKVPQESGEIVISDAGDEPKTYRVTDHVASVPRDEVDLFLRVVDGAELTSGGNPSGSTKE